MSGDLIMAPPVTGWGASTKTLKTHWEPQLLFLWNTATNNDTCRVAVKAKWSWRGESTLERTEVSTGQYRSQRSLLSSAHQNPRRSAFSSHAGCPRVFPRVPLMLTLLLEFLTLCFILLTCWTLKSSQFISVAQSCPTLCDPMGLQHARPPCPSPTPGAYSNSCPLSWWCHPTISSSVVPFSSHLQSFPASGSFQISQLFASGGQSIGVSASTSVLPMNIQDWFPLGWTGWISLQSKGLSRVFSNPKVQKYQFFCAQLSLISLNSSISP